MEKRCCDGVSIEMVKNAVSPAKTGS